MLSKSLCAYVIIFLFTFLSYGQDSLNKQKKKWHKTTFSKVVAVPAILTGAGLYTASRSALFSRYDVKRNLDSEFPGFSSSFEDYLRYVPPASVYLLDLAGVKSKNNFRDKSLIFLKTNILALAIVFPLKGLTKVRRPDNSSSASFPSLHTAQAFLGATFLHKELGHRSPWYSIVGYTMAATTGVFRMLNNKHWLSDVLVGAAVGILSANIVYATHKFKPRKNKQGVRLSVVPSYTRGPGISLVLTQ